MFRRRGGHAAPVRRSTDLMAEMVMQVVNAAIIDLFIIHYTMLFIDDFPNT